MTGPLVRGFAPIAEAGARVLVLGTMPSEASLSAGCYYAHPRNAFWPIVERLFGDGRDLDYAERQALLTSSGVALWDVLHAVVRPGSLDASIVAGSEVPNDIAGFLAGHPSVRAICFNGSTAQALFRRHVARTIETERLTLMRLPSTSPARASLSFDQKLEAWRALAELAREAG